jgi:glycerol-3-phosphate dehydrogenase (NAD(P)+)
MAIGAGVIEGLRLGTNTQAAFVTRALAEMKRLGKALGAKETTFMGLSGMGDLILTSYGNLSRNRLFGVELAKGKKAQDIIDSQKNVVEGYYATDAAHNLSKKLNIEMPITEELQAASYPIDLLLAEKVDRLTDQQRTALQTARVALQRLARVAEKTMPPVSTPSKKK